MQKERIDWLDYLRGYFIIVIIADHSWRYPSLLSFITGQGQLWMGAAEGFVIISGFLIGYIRGYKSQQKPFSLVAKKLTQRAVILYIAMIIASIIYVAIEWTNVIASMPSIQLNNGVRDWLFVLKNIVNLSYPHAWIHFLALYTRFLILSIGAVWLLRHNMSRLVFVISAALYLWGYTTQTEWLMWQTLFFLPSIAGYHFTPLQAKLIAHKPQLKRSLMNAVLIYSGITVLVSVYCTFLPYFGMNPFLTNLNALFQFHGTVISLIRIINAFIWFSALAIVFARITPQLQKTPFVGKLVHYLGTHSLQAYIMHGFIICGMTLVFPPTKNWALNTLYGCIAIVATWGLIQLPGIRRVVPK